MEEVDKDGEDGGVKEETIDFVREKVVEVKAKGGGREHAATVASLIWDTGKRMHMAIE